MSASSAKSEYSSGPKLLVKGEKSSESASNAQVQPMPPTLSPQPPTPSPSIQSPSPNPQPPAPSPRTIPVTGEPPSQPRVPDPSQRGPRDRLPAAPGTEPLHPCCLQTPRGSTEMQRETPGACRPAVFRGFGIRSLVGNRVGDSGIWVWGLPSGAGKNCHPAPPSICGHSRQTRARTGP